MTKLLLVEDEAHIAQGLRFNLEAEGFDVEICEEGEQALALLKRDPRRFDLLVLDFMLPG
jgi:DNA-binding response OmpR family regulator